MIRHKCPLIKYIVLAKCSFSFAHDVSGGGEETLKELFGQPNNSVLIRTVVFKLLVSELLYILKITEDPKGLLYIWTKSIYAYRIGSQSWKSVYVFITSFKTSTKIPITGYHK